MSPTNDGVPARGCETHAAPHCSSCVGRGSSTEWCVLGEDDLRQLEAARITNVYRAGQFLFYQGNPCLGLHCVESGEIALRKTDGSGQSRIVRMAHAGLTLGYRAFFSGTPYTTSAEALSDSTVCFIPRETVARLVERAPSLGMRFLQRTALDLKASEEDGLNGSKSVRGRLAHFVLAFKDRLGTMGEDGVLSIPLPLSRQDIAARIGARPETVTRAIRALEDDSVATFDGRTVRIPDLDRLLDELETAGID